MQPNWPATRLAHLKMSRFDLQFVWTANPIDPSRLLLIEVENMVHKFHVGYTSHPLAWDNYHEPNQLASKIKELGYVLVNAKFPNCRKSNNWKEIWFANINLYWCIMSTISISILLQKNTLWFYLHWIWLEQESSWL